MFRISTGSAINIDTDKSQEFQTIILKLKCFSTIGKNGAEESDSDLLLNREVEPWPGSRDENKRKKPNYKGLQLKITINLNHKKFLSAAQGTILLLLNSKMPSRPRPSAAQRQPFGRSRWTILLLFFCFQSRSILAN